MQVHNDLNVLRTLRTYRKSDKLTYLIAGMVLIHIIVTEGRRPYHLTYVNDERFAYRLQLVQADGILEW